MIPLFNFRGYTANDPLDRAPAAMQLVLTCGVSAAIALGMLYLESSVLKAVTFKSVWVFWIGCAIYTFVMGPLLALLRKSSSLLFFLLLVALCVSVDIWLQSHFRDRGLEGWWTYPPGSFLSAIAVPLRFLVAWSFNGIIQGPIVLWLTRLLASAVYPARQAQPQPTFDQQAALFPDQWSLETVAKPDRDAGYWLLRLLGLGYLSYLGFCVLGLLGTSVWPQAAQRLLVMTYQNPALGINTFAKISLMVLLAFMGAYNRKVRWHATLCLLIGHLASTASSLAFYLYDTPPDPVYHGFLLTSAIVDGAMILIFGWILIRYRASARTFFAEKQFPDFFSLPDLLNRILFYTIGAGLALAVPAVIWLRVKTSGASGISAVFGFPDPQLGNTITMFVTMSLLAFLMARRVKLRDYLQGVLVFALAVTVVGNGLWSIAGPWLGRGILTRGGVMAPVDWYFVLATALGGVAIVALLGLRKMYYDIDYTINALNPSSARNVITLHDAIYGDNGEDSALVLQRIDAHVAGIRGRKRGLLNFPFWIVEQILSPVYWLHPTFSTMSQDEQRYFLRRSLLRPPRERAQAFIPLLADLAYKIGMAVHALITFAHFTTLKGWVEASYVPPDARNRLQSNYPSKNPPFTEVAALPDGPGSPANEKPRDPLTAPPLVAPRVSTPVGQGAIPDTVDYLIVGSGAGGACMAYRLACEVADPSRILVVDRGPRYSPLQDFNDDEMEMIRKLYKEGGLQQSKRFDLMVLQGECVGGTTVVNNAICFEMPDRVKETWRNEYGLDLGALEAEYKLVAQEIEITQIPNVAINQSVREKFFGGVDKYNADPNHKPGLKEEVLCANQRNMMGDGLDNLGNRRLRKRSMLETYLPWAEARGVQIIGELSAVRFLTDESGKRADQVMLRTSTGDLKNVKVRKAVIVAGGVIASSHFLMRSDLKGNVGRGMSCNFAFPVAFDFDEHIDAFDGTQITLGAVDRQNRAVFESYFNPPGAFALSLPFYFDRQRNLMSRYRNLLNFGALVGAEPNGVIALRGDALTGRPFTWTLGDEDRANIKYALTTLLELGRLAGASRGVLPTEPGLEIPLTEADLARFTRELADYPLQMSDLRLTTAHPQGGNRMIGDGSAHRSERVVDSRFRVDGFENVFVADASIFPTGITVNPQWTIMAMSSMAAKQVLEFAERRPIAARS
jgi:choline dehydrogenase-like flavoprotein